MRCDQRVKLLNLQFSLSLGCLLLGAFYWVPTAQKKKTIGCLRHKKRKQLGAYGTKKENNWVPTPKSKKRKKEAGFNTQGKKPKRSDFTLFYWVPTAQTK